MQLLQLDPVLLLDPVDEAPDERHDDPVLRRRDPVLDAQREQERQHLGRDHLLRQAKLVVVYGHFVNA